MLSVNCYNMRPIERKDLEIILEWRNTARIHSMMLTDHQITWDEHLNWFEKCCNKNPCRNLIFEFCEKPIGYIGYTEVDDVKKICSPGAYIGSDKDVPIDAGMYLFYCAIEYAFEFLNMKVLKTEVIKKNKQALRLDELMGYEVVGENSIFKNGKEVETYVLILKKDKWDQIKMNYI